MLKILEIWDWESLNIAINEQMLHFCSSLSRITFSIIASSILSCSFCRNDLAWCWKGNSSWGTSSFTMKLYISPFVISIKLKFLSPVNKVYFSLSIWYIRHLSNLIITHRPHYPKSWNFLWVRQAHLKE